MIVSCILFVNGIILLSIRNKNTRSVKIGIKQAILVGFIQCLAIFPGISRSGITIVAMIHSGIDRKDAFKFSFIISIPIIFAAFLLKIKDVYAYMDGQLSTLLVGTSLAFISGLLALKILKYIMNQSKLYVFGYYCIILSCGLIVWFKLLGN